MGEFKFGEGRYETRRSRTNNLMGRGKDKEKEVNGERRRGRFKGEGEGSKWGEEKGRV